MSWEHGEPVINFASGLGVFAEEVTFELDFERRALHRTKSGPSAKTVSLENQSSHPEEGQLATDAPCPEDAQLPHGVGVQTLSLETGPHFRVQLDIIFHCLALSAHRQLGALISRQTSLAFAP